MPGDGTDSKGMAPILRSVLIARAENALTLILHVGEFDVDLRWRCSSASFGDQLQGLGRQVAFESQAGGAAVENRAGRFESGFDQASRLALEVEGLEEEAADAGVNRTSTMGGTGDAQLVRSLCSGHGLPVKLLHGAHRRTVSAVGRLNSTTMTHVAAMDSNFANRCSFSSIRRLN